MRCWPHHVFSPPLPLSPSHLALPPTARRLKWPGSDLSEATLKDMGIYGLGTKRSLEQYAEFSGVDTIHQKSQGRCIVQYVPWDWAHPMVPEELDNAWEHQDKKKQPPAHKAVAPDEFHDNSHNIDPKKHAAIKEVLLTWA